MVLVHIWSHGPLPPFGRHSLISIGTMMMHNLKKSCIAIDNGIPLQVLLSEDRIKPELQPH